MPHTVQLASNKNFKVILQFLLAEQQIKLIRLMIINII